jgi:enoyl-[acyl-carrier-protein] reductase (NADH)
MQEVAYPSDPRPKVWDPETRVGSVLSGKRGLVVGIATENSIACGCAAKLRVRGAELGENGVRVYAVSPGPLKTRAASGIPQFEELVDTAMERSPARRLVDTAEVGRVVAFLVGFGASGVTGHTISVDASLHIVVQS